MDKRVRTGRGAPLQRVMAEPVSDPAEQAALDEERRRQPGPTSSLAGLYGQLTPEDQLAFLIRMAAQLSPEAQLAFLEQLASLLPTDVARQLEEELRGLLAKCSN
jgi:hypothetical protein